MAKIPITTKTTTMTKMSVDTAEIARLAIASPRPSSRPSSPRSLICRSAMIPKGKLKTAIGGKKISRMLSTNAVIAKLLVERG
jgi:hypothetical protein